LNSRQAGSATFLISSKVIYVSFKSTRAGCDRTLQFTGAQAA